MENGVAIRSLTETDRRAAARVYVGGLGDEEVRPLMPGHMDLAEGIFADLIEPGADSWVAESDAGEVIGLALCQEPPASSPAMGTWATYRRHLPLLAALRARFVARYLYRVKLPEDAVYLQSLVVTQEWRGRGVGSALVDFVCQTARQRGYAKVTLNVVDANDRARHLYERLGFSRVKTTPTGFYRHLVGWGAVDSMEKWL